MFALLSVYWLMLCALAIIPSGSAGVAVGWHRPHMGYVGRTAFDCRSVQPLPICDPVEGMGLVSWAASASAPRKVRAQQPDRELQPRLDLPCKSKVVSVNVCSWYIAD